MRIRDLVAVVGIVLSFFVILNALSPVVPKFYMLSMFFASIGFAVWSRISGDFV